MMCLNDVGAFKKLNFVLILVMSIHFGCTDYQDEFGKRRVPVDIYDLTIPTNGTVNEDIIIQLKAQAPNGCFSDLDIKLIELDSRHFLFKADGLFETKSVCSYMLVNKETTITFRPASRGMYFFRTNEDPFEIRRDTININ